MAHRHTWWRLAVWVLSCAAVLAPRGASHAGTSSENTVMGRLARAMAPLSSGEEAVPDIPLGREATAAAVAAAATLGREMDESYPSPHPDSPLVRNGVGRTAKPGGGGTNSWLLRAHPVGLPPIGREASPSQPSPQAVHMAVGAEASTGGSARRLFQAPPGVTTDWLINGGNIVLGWDVTLDTGGGAAGLTGVVHLDVTQNNVVQAWRVTIPDDGNIYDGVSVPGGSIYIIAHELRCGDSASIDSKCGLVSIGWAGDPFPGQEWNGFDGKDGGDGTAGFSGGYPGENGWDAGPITIFTETFDTRVLLSAQGGDGGPGVVGGNGGRGSQPPARPASACDSSKSKLSKCVAPFDGSCLVGLCMQSEWWGLDGAPGGNGGNAGANGDNGNGGNGGAITVRFAALAPAGNSSIQYSNGPGYGGNQQMRGAAGAGGEGGFGGCPSRMVLTPVGFLFKCTETCTSCGPQSDYREAEYGSKGPSGRSGQVPDLRAPGNNGTSGEVSIRYSTVQDWGAAKMSPEFLRLLLRKARQLYLAGDRPTAYQVGDFITRASLSCGAGTVKAQCDAIAKQAGAMLYRLSQNLDFYGNPSSWVPTVGISVINQNVERALSALEVVEASYSKVLDTAAVRADKQAAVRQAIAKAEADNNGGLIQDMQDQQRDLESELYYIQATLDSKLGPQKRFYYGKVLKYAAQFETAIKQKQAGDRMWLMFSTALDCVDFIGAAVGVAEAGAKGLTGFAAAGKRLAADFQQSGNPPQPVQVWSTLQDTSPAGAAYAWGQAKGELGAAADPERAKMLVEKARLDTLLASYMSLPAGADYHKAMAAYVAAAQNYNDGVLKINYLWTSLLQSQKDAAAMRLQVDTLKTLLDDDDDPMHPQSVDMVLAAYYHLQELVLYYLYQENAALNYAALSRNAFIPPATLTFAALKQQHIKLRGDMAQSLVANFPKQTTSFSPVVLNGDTVPGFADMLARRKVSFRLAGCTGAFSASSVVIKSVSISAPGAVARNGSSSEAKLSFYLSHPGRSELMTVDGRLMSFTHLERLTLHSYDVVSGSVRTQGRFDYDLFGKHDPADPLSDIYISVSPLTVWELDFSTIGAINSDVDLSGVQSLVLNFEGSVQLLNAAGRSAVAALCPYPCAWVTCTSSDPGPCQTAGTCNPATGACSAPANKTDGAVCPGGSCQAGVCRDLCAGVTCPAAGPCQRAGTCQPLTGKCSVKNKPSTTRCKLAGGKQGMCKKGQCTDLCAGVQCAKETTCKLAGTCTANTGKCAAGASKPDGTPCSAGKACKAGACSKTTSG